MAGLARFVELLDRAERIVAFTGAGGSAESGIPDFRSPGGVWDRYRPIDYREFVRDPEARRETWRRGLQTYPVLAAAEPNPAHLALAELERRGKLLALVTQNIDGLHQRAGSSPERVIELHGNSHTVRCLQCEQRYTRLEVHARVEAGDEHPDCLECGGWLKPATVSFGEAMPADAMARAERAALACDLFLVVGSSLVVYPAAAIPELAVQRSVPLVIVNATETQLDVHAAVVLREKAGLVLREALERLPSGDARV
jgi:NAD-dependent deacetylase